MLHESNAYPGLAVRMLAKRTTTIMVGFKEAKEKLTKAKRVVLTGTPTKISNTRIDKDKVRGGRIIWSSINISFSTMKRTKWESRITQITFDGWKRQE